MTGPNERDEIAEPILLQSIRRMAERDPERHVRIINGTGTTVRGFVAEVDDWLAERDRRTAATALREAADELAPRASSDEPCDNADACCGSDDSCDAIRPMRRVVGEDWLRDRAERIERNAR